MIFLAVNYHYFGDENEYPNGGIYPVSETRFLSQLNEIGKVFSFISQNDLLLAINGKKLLPAKSCLITFDDGLSCQYEKALPILETKNIPALFFVNTLPFVEKRVCQTHKVHFLIAKLGVEKFLLSINKELQEKIFCNVDSFFDENNTQLALQKYRYDSQNAAKLKYLINVILDSKIKSLVLDNLFSEAFGSEDKIVEDLYLSENQVKDLHQRGFLGIHGHNHFSLGLLSDEALEHDIFISKKYIETLTGIEVKAISYPFGGVGDVNQRTISQCKKIGFNLGFTMERAFNNSLENPLALARFDTNDIWLGKKPKFDFDIESIEKRLEALPKRSLYFKE